MNRENYYLHFLRTCYNPPSSEGPYNLCLKSEPYYPSPHLSHLVQLIENLPVNHARFSVDN